jgi:glycolate oxidase
VLFDPTNRDHWVGVKKAEKEILEYVESIGGVITAEHGLGYVKNIYVEKAVGEVKLRLDREIKRVFDPDNILNPGKMGLDSVERDDNVQFMYDEYVTDSELWGR